MKNEHSQIMHELGTIAGELKGINGYLKTLNGKVVNHQKEIGRIKESRARQTGVVVGISSVVSVVWAFITTRI